MKIVWIGLAVLAGLGAAIATLAIESTYLSNTFGARDLVMRAALFGAIVGGLIGWLTTRGVQESITKFQLLSVSLLATIAVSIWAAAYSNRVGAAAIPEMQRYQFEKMIPYYNSRTGLVKATTLAPAGYFLTVSDNEQTTQLRLRQPLFEDKEKGDWIELPLYTGWWGYRFFNPTVVQKQ